MRKLSDKQRILRLALSRGHKGFTAVDFLAPDVADGLKPITRVAARVNDLRNEGIRFTDGGRRNACKVYILDRSSLADSTLPPAPVSGASADRKQHQPEMAGALSSSPSAGVPETAPRNAIFDWDEAA